MNAGEEANSCSRVFVGHSFSISISINLIFLLPESRKISPDLLPRGPNSDVLNDLKDGTAGRTTRELLRDCVSAHAAAEDDSPL